MLSYSRVHYVEFVERQDLDTFIRCHLNAFEAVGGVPATILYDNTKVVVLGREDDGRPHWHPRFADFAGLVGFVPRLCRPYRAQTKGRVERLVRYVRENFWPGRQFTDLQDLNHQVSAWCHKTNQRVHGTTKAVPLSVLGEERQHLLGLPAVQYRQAGAARLLQRLAGKDWNSPGIAPDLDRIDRYESGFVTFLLLFGYLRPGYEYLFSRKFTGMVREAPFSPLGQAVEAVALCGYALGFGKRHVEAFIPLVLLRLLIQTGKPLEGLTTQDLEAFRLAAGRYAASTGRSQRHYTISLHAVENVLYHLGVLRRPAVHGSARRTPWAERFQDIAQAGLRRTMAVYLDKLGTTHRYSTVLGYCRSFRLLARFPAEHAPEVSEVSDLDRRRHIEPWLLWNAHRVRKVQGAQTRPISQEDKKTAVVDVRCFLDQIAEWGWPESPPRRLLFNGDIPKLDYPLPRYIPQEQEQRLMAAIRTLDDPLERYGLLILRATGMRIGELIDLELDCVHHVPGKGAWLKVPLGKLHTERMVPLDDDTLGLLDAVAQLRGTQKPLPHPQTGVPTEFLFVRRGKRVSREFIREGLAKAVTKAQLLDQDGNPLRITPHQLRHTLCDVLGQRWCYPPGADASPGPRDHGNEPTLWPSL